MASGEADVQATPPRVHRFDRPGFWNKWWSWHAIVVVSSIGAMFLSVAMTPSTGFLELWGLTIPEVCAYRKLFGWECFGCGLTRSFVFMGHGEPSAAWEMNKLGPVMFLLFAVQLPYRTFRIWQGRPPVP